MLFKIILFMIVIRFRYVCCYELFLAWFCCYDVDTVLDMILIWFQFWFLIGSNMRFEANPSEPYPKSYQIQIKIVSKSHQKRIKIVSKSYQNPKNLRKTTKNLSLGCFCFFFWCQLTGTISKPYQNHIKTVSRAYQNRIKIVSKPYQNHIKTIKIFLKNRPKTCPWAVSVSFSEANSLEPYQNRIKIISQSYQERIKIVSKPYQNIKTTKTREKSTKRLSRGCFRFLSWSQPVRNPEKDAPFPNHIKTISKSHLKYSKTISKP